MPLVEPTTKEINRYLLLVNEDSREMVQDIISKIGHVPENIVIAYTDKVPEYTAIQVDIDNIEPNEEFRQLWESHKSKLQ